jgi:hypothetical protein
MKAVLLLSALLVAGCVGVPMAQRLQEAESSGVCYVHGGRMEKERLLIAYGLIGFRKEFTEARLAQFPFARRALLGGCMIMTVPDHPELSSPAYGEDYVCEECTAAKARWIRNHPQG